MSDALYELINQLLCDLTVLQRNIHILHWNLKSDNFIEQHPYLGDIYTKLFDYVDETAEQIRFNDAYPHSSLSSCVHSSTQTDIDSLRPYSWSEAVFMCIDYLEYLNNLTKQITTVADSEQQWSIVQVFSDHSVWYDKTLYFFKNSKG